MCGIGIGGDGRRRVELIGTPWGVQIYGYELAVARVGPEGWKNAEQNAIEGNGMETRINAKY